jgi:hypothetical protein
LLNKALDYTRHGHLKKFNTLTDSIHAGLYTPYPVALSYFRVWSYFHNMNNFFVHWVDLTAMLLSIIAAVVLAVKMRRNYAVRGVAAFFLVLGPLVTGVHMFFHLLNITYNAIERFRIHAFTYDFRFYSLYLMAGVLSYLSVRLLRQSLYKCAGLQSSNRPIYKTMLAIAPVSLPTVAFTPIGSLPAFGCVVTLVALAFLKRNATSFARAALPAVANKAA